MKSCNEKVRPVGKVFVNVLTQVPALEPKVSHLLILFIYYLLISVYLFSFRYILFSGLPSAMSKIEYNSFKNHHSFVKAVIFFRNRSQMAYNVLELSTIFGPIFICGLAVLKRFLADVSDTLHHPSSGRGEIAEN